MSEGWGDALSCDRCGHPAGYHGVTFCQVQAGGASKRRCDCEGWKARAAVRMTAPKPTMTNAVAGPQTVRPRGVYS